MRTKAFRHLHCLCYLNHLLEIGTNNHLKETEELYTDIWLGLVMVDMLMIYENKHQFLHFCRNEKGVLYVEMMSNDNSDQSS
ncbi:hypothetical protein AQUCO_01100299v1 [Aquilegia coerulea]|uniref:Uncharacterized protein n=1 Tax=Aquilegia coerulea TaxID=218851 RepID=A0A2G5E6M8_AQUCA|nr:hypothetical protein AQUCO_01100299v1 [Aquilegia coerulea]